MSQHFIGDVALFGGNFPPLGWAFCQGQLLDISQYTPLFALIGTTYGGDGVTTFALPNLQGRFPIHQGQGGGLSNYVIGEMAGASSVALTSAQIPAHTHQVFASSAVATTNDPTGNVPAKPVQVGGSNTVNAFAVPGATVPMSAGAISPTGASLPHDNMQPYLGMNYIIALQGIFPSQN